MFSVSASTKTTAINMITIFLVFLFIYTGWDKLINTAVFQMQIAKIGYMKKFAPVVSITIPVIELLTAGCLIFPLLRNFGILAAANLMTLFTLYVLIMLLSGIKLPCSCGGIIAKMSWRTHLWFNLGIALAAWWAFIVSKKMYAVKISKTNFFQFREQAENL